MCLQLQINLMSLKIIQFLSCSKIYFSGIVLSPSGTFSIFLWDYVDLGNFYFPLFIFQFGTVCMLSENMKNFHCIFVYFQIPYR